MGAKVDTRQIHKLETRFLGETGFLILAFLLAFALRALRLDFQPLWWDEGYSVWFATHPLGQMAALTAADIHPPLYYALLHVWTLLLGTGPVALRLLSVVFGALAVPAVYLAGRRLAPSSRVPLLAALLLAINPLHVFYSQEVRMYGLVALLSVGVLAAAWRVFDTETRRHGDAEKFAVSPRLRVSASLPVYILLTTAALYTQYYAVFLPIGLTLYATWRWRRDVRALARWLAAQAVIALLYLPWVLYAAPKLVPYVSQKVVADADKPLGFVTYAARHLAAFLGGHLEGALAPGWPIVLAFLAPLGLGWWLAARKRTADNNQHPRAISHPPSAISLLATILLATLALGWLISLRAPFFPERGERLLILALPAFVLLAAAGLDALWRRWRIAGYVTLGLLVAASAASLAGFYTVPRYTDDDYRPLIARVTEQGLPKDMVLAVYPWQVGYWRSYGHPSGPAALLTPDTEWGPSLNAALDDALACGRVWFPAHLALGAILETAIEAHLAGQALPFVNQWHGPGTRLSAWALAAQPGPVPADEAHFTIAGNGTLRLTGVDALPGSPVPAANAVTPLTLHWQAAAQPPILAASVRLTDDLGQIWAQHDYAPLGRTVSFVTLSEAKGLGDSSLPMAAQNDSGAAWQATDRLGLLIPAGTPPGRYHVELVVQTQDGVRALDAQTPDGRALGQSARLFEIGVTAADRPLGIERLPITVRRPMNLGDGLRFLGHSTDQTPLAPGELRKVNLFWQATSQPASDYNAFVQVLGRDGAPVALWEAPAGAAFPTSAWTPGTLMRTQASFRIPASVPNGRYQLITGLFRATDKARLRTVSGGDHIALGYITVRSRPHQMTPPAPPYPTDVTFDALARLVGYDLTAAETQLGGAFTLTLHWQALAATERPYTVFVHLLDQAGAIHGYGDSEPGNGAFPTPGWLTGEYLADAHTVTVAADAEPGPYQLAVGFYDPATGERLKTATGEDRTVLGTVIAVR